MRRVGPSRPSLDTPGGIAAESLSPPMQRFFDKWFLPFAFVVIGCIIGWALWRR